MRIRTLPAILFVLAGCSSRRESPAPAKQTATPAVLTTSADTSAIEKSLIAAGLIDIQTVIPEIRVDLRYSGTNNFMNMDLYGDLTKAYLQPDVAEMLAKAFQNLKLADSSLNFIIYDAARPLRVQYQMWDSLRIAGDKTKYVSNPHQGSLHNYGAALDLSVCDESGTALDMGTGYDFFGELAQPQLESHFLSTGELTDAQYQNRLILRKAMTSAGFRQLPTEWWHYNACSRETARIKYKILE